MAESRPAFDPFREGIQLFNEEYFFEAHDVWEALWREEHGEARLFLQALIQVAAGFHHVKNGNVRGALALFEKALTKLRRYPARYMEIDSRALIEAVEARRAVIGRPGQDPGAMRLDFPKIL